METNEPNKYLDTLKKYETELNDAQVTAEVNQIIADVFAVCIRFIVTCGSFRADILIAFPFLSFHQGIVKLNRQRD